MKKENENLKKIIGRLNVEIVKYNPNYEILSDTENEDTEELPPWIINTN